MNLFDEMIETLRCEQEVSEYTYISPETLKSFYSVTDELRREISKENRQQSKLNIPVESVVCEKRINSYNPVQENKKDVLQNTRDCSQQDMQQLKEAVAGCNKCGLCRSKNNTVFGEGSFTADLMLIGEGPGRDEDLQGRPFVGRSGQLLTKMLKAMGFDREEVFICNIVKCRPPQNRNPSPDEADACIPYLLRQIEIIKPRVIVLLGAVPLKFILNKTGITRIHGQWFEFRGIKTLPTFHPSFLLRDPRQKKYAWEDLQKVMRVLGKKYIQFAKRQSIVEKNKD